MRWIRRLFLIAGIYGLVVFVPMYFAEPAFESENPPINYPAFFYGFNGLGLAWQLAFLVIAKDPIRYRPMMIPCVVEKFSFAGAAISLYLIGRVPGGLCIYGGIDLLLGILFVVAYVQLGRTGAQAP
jgi:hypothetical protein